MATESERIRALVSIGILPETAQDIVAAETIGDVTADARITQNDRARARLFALYSPLIPDRMRLMFDAETLNDAS